MDLSVSARDNLKNAIVSISCLIGAAIGGYYLYLDLTALGGAGQGKPVGKVERRESKVSRKKSSSFAWNNVETNEELFRKDSIQTGRGSAAGVRLTDGTLLDIGENSLVVLDDTKELSLNFLKGSAVVHKADGDARISVRKDGTTQVEELPVRLLLPESLSKVFGPDKEFRSIVFRWESRTKLNNDSYVVQVATDKGFSPQFTRNIPTLDPKTRSVKVDLRPGKYFWRVISKNSDDNKGEVRQFKVIGVSALQTVFPNGQKITGTPSESVVQFRWLNPRLLGVDDSDLTQGEHKLEIAADPEFKKITMAETVNPLNGSTSIKDFPDGPFFWRMRSNYPNYTAASATKTFEFKKLIPLPTASGLASAPELLLLPYPGSVKPEPGTVFNILQMKDPIQASWAEVEGADEYEIQVFMQAKPGLPKKQVLSRRTGKSSMTFKDLKVGEYEWTIRSVDKKNRPGEPLPTRRFTVTYGETLAAPEVLSPEVQ